MQEVDTAHGTLGEAAIWDERQQHFLVPLHGNKTFGALVILKNAPLPLAHLETHEHQRSTPLGPELHQRLEAEVNAAIGRGAHQVATGLSLLTRDEVRAL